MRATLGMLQETGWLAEQPDAFHAAMLRIGRWRRFAAGRVLWRA